MNCNTDLSIDENGSQGLGTLTDVGQKACILRAPLFLDLSKISEEFCAGEASKSSFNCALKLIIHSFICSVNYIHMPKIMSRT